MNKQITDYYDVIAPGSFGMYKGFRVLVRRVAIIAGQVQYWILMPDRVNSFAWVYENEITREV